MEEIEIIDTTLRDGPQSLWATRMTTAHMLPAIEPMDRAGFRNIELGGCLVFDVCIRYLKENPWERVKLVHRIAKRTPFRTLMRSNSLFHFDPMAEDINLLWIELICASGYKVVGSVDGLNDLDNIASQLIRAKQLGAKTYGPVAFTQSPVHTDEMFVRVAKEFISRCNVDSVMLKDAGGLLTVDRIRTLVPALLKATGDVPLELHSHCTTGLAPLVYLEAVKLGVKILQTSIAPLANGVAQPATQTMVQNVRHLGYRVNLDDALIDQVSQHFRKIAEREGKPVGVPLEYNAFHYEHQMPGGMQSNFKSQLKDVGLLHKFDDVLHECARMRSELGWPNMMTPFSQIVGSQAMLNVMHGERYRVVPDALKKYVLGYYGKLPGPVDPNVLDKIVQNGSKNIPLQPQPLPPVVPAMRKKYPNMSDEERVLRHMYAGTQVDDMFAAGPMRTECNYGTPVVDLLKQLMKLPKPGRVFIRKEDFQIELKGAPERDAAGG